MLPPTGSDDPMSIAGHDGRRAGRRPVRRLATLLVLLAGSASPLAQAAPFVPGSDEEIVERLPYRRSEARAAPLAAFGRAPQTWQAAAQRARAAIERARRHGDPRELGVAQAALAPWWNLAEPPAELRLLRASIRQSEHRFDAALEDLQALQRDPAAPAPLAAQAALMRAAVHQLAGRWAAAERDCRTLLESRWAALGDAVRLPAQVCLAELRSLQGQPAVADRTLAALARQAPDSGWIALVRAELAVRRGDHDGAAARFREALQSEDSVYTRAAFADWWLDRGQPREALAVVDTGPDAAADALLLRRVIALHRLGDARAGPALSTLTNRLATARLRGEAIHAREEARLALDVLQQPARALALARENWQQQREPADAVLLWRSAQAAGDPAAAAALADWTGSPASATDVRLAGLERSVGP